MASTAGYTVSNTAPKPGFVDRMALACDAIESAKCLEIGYRDYARIVEVHRVGVGRCGEHILSGWQIRGPAQERAGWKLLNLDEAESVILTEIASRAPRPDYRRGAKQFIGIICQL
jgi:hypothetical protein